MSEAVLVAVPSNSPGGLDAAPSAHFGHCDAYTVATLENGSITEIKVVENGGHGHGACIQPVQDLADAGVGVLLAGGMGARPLNAMLSMGIKPFYATGFNTVREALEAYAENKLQPFGLDQLCKGNCGHHDS